MLTISTIVKRSPIHGHGCFAGEEVAAGTIVWRLGETDQHFNNPLKMSVWEHHHAYRSRHEEELWILPRDNAAWINFARAKDGECGEPNLREGEMINGEPCLMAARQIGAGEELTVGPETDRDSPWKLTRMLDCPLPL